MAKRSSRSFSATTWLRRIYRRLTSRMACFVWGALLGNALLNQPIEPLNLLLAPPEHMLSPAAQQGLETLRDTVREASSTLRDTAWNMLRTLVPTGYIP